MDYLLRMFHHLNCIAQQNTKTSGFTPRNLVNLLEFLRLVGFFWGGNFLKNHHHLRWLLHGKKVAIPWRHGIRLTSWLPDSAQSGGPKPEAQQNFDGFFNSNLRNSQLRKSMFLVHFSNFVHTCNGWRFLFLNFRNNSSNMEMVWWYQLCLKGDIKGGEGKPWAKIGIRFTFSTWHVSNHTVSPYTNQPTALRGKGFMFVFKV